MSGSSKINFFPSHSSKRFKLFHHNTLTRRAKRNSFRTNSDSILLKMYYCVLVISGIITIIQNYKKPLFLFLIELVGSLIRISSLTLFLAITHHSILQKFFHTSYEHTLWLHKKSGKQTIKLIKLHSFLYVVAFFVSKISMITIDKSSVPSTRGFVFSLLTFVLLFGLKKGLKLRKKIYEPFYFSHVIITIFLFPVSAFTHDLKPFLCTTAVGFSLWVIDLFYRIFLFYFKTPAKIVAIRSQKNYLPTNGEKKTINKDYNNNNNTKGDDENNSENNSKDKNSENNGYKSHTYIPDSKVLTVEMDNFQYEPMQWVRLCIPSISKYQMHPLTICSPPMLPDEKTGKVRIDILIKAMGDWSKKVVDSPSKFLLDKPVKIEGPLGTSSLDVLSYKYFILIGGGCGVGPILSLMLALKELRDTDFGDKLIKLKFFWMVKEFQELELFQDQLEQASDQFKKYEVKCFATRQKREDFENKYTIPDFVNFGRPDFSQILKSTAENAQKKNVKRIGVFACGPARLVKQIQNDCLDSSNSEIVLDFSREVTGF
ncbi:nadph oxidase 4 [Anaeramoeba flamelloides]|uniref:Nadph oxidase 4 n=1 Tax=Anaeramoeba flamelloides TaxID=1746091 RepID=A0ABQ8YJ22_9EUKA|nr:nadph oxidase 4 [Anaeramoeba flamelloides]